MQKFKDYASELVNKKHELLYKRTFNGLIFSIYEKQIFDKDYRGVNLKQTDKYLGTCLNFFKLNSKVISPSFIPEPSGDTLSVDNSYRALIDTAAR